MLNASPSQNPLSRENPGGRARLQHNRSRDIQPDVPVSEHPAQAGPDGWLAGCSAGPLLVLQRTCMRRGSAVSNAPWSQMTSIVLRVVASQFSHCCGVCGRSSTGRSITLQIAQRPSWARWSRWAVRLTGRALLRRRLAQYSVSAGSSGGRSLLDGLVSDDVGPGEPVHERAASAVAEHPPVLPGLVELGEVPGNDPGRPLVRVAEGRPLVGELPQVLIELAERLGGYLRPVVGGPSPDDRVEPSDHRRCVGPAQGPELPCGAVPGSV